MLHHIKPHFPKPTLFKFSPLQLCSQSLLIHSKLFCHAITPTARQFQTFSVVNEKTKDNPIWLNQNIEGSKITVDDVSSFFPYGESDFVSIRQSKHFFVDKTEYIPLLEKIGKQLFFVRPPRWGKTLLLKMLGAYYDISMKERFDELFGDLWIGKKENWTAGKNQFHVLHLNFSIEVEGRDEISKTLHDSLNGDLNIFISKYKLENVVVSERNAFATYKSVIQILLQKQAKLMVLIDEYDLPTS